MSANQMPGHFRVGQVSHLNPAGLVALALPHCNLEWQSRGRLFSAAANRRYAVSTDAVGQCARA